MNFCPNCGNKLNSTLCDICNTDTSRFIFCDHSNRITMPYPDSRPALVVPFDYDSIIPFDKPRWSFILDAKNLI